MTVGKTAKTKKAIVQLNRRQQRYRDLRRVCKSLREHYRGTVVMYGAMHDGRCKSDENETNSKGEK